jgi:cortactin
VLIGICFTCPYLQFLDYAKGFGGKFGVESDRQDKSASGWDYQEKLAQHESQTGNHI